MMQYQIECDERMEKQLQLTVCMADQLNICLFEYICGYDYTMCDDNNTVFTVSAIEI